MKKVITTLLFSFLCLQIALFATHNRAGEILIEQISPTEIKASIITFTKSSSLPADRDSLQICWGDGNCSWIQRSSESTLTNDNKRNVYQQNYTYSEAGSYTISMTDPNRNGGILNVNAPNSDQQAFHIETQFELSTTQNNHSPTLLFPPIDVAFTNQPFFHNPNGFDIDGDQLVYELMTPMKDNGESVDNYVMPNMISPNANNSLTLDANTGHLVWNSPQQEGEYNIAIKISEYREGVLIGYAIRDMQILVLKEEVLPPTIELVDQSSSTNGFEVKFDITATDPMQKIKLTATGGPLILEESPASFSAPTDFQSGPVTATFNWVTTNTHVRDEPYQIVLKAENDALTDHGVVVLKTITIDTKNKTTPTLQIEQGLNFNYYPNPTRDFLVLDFRQIIQEDIHFQLFSLTGQLKQSQYLPKGVEKTEIDLSNYTAGIYVVKIQWRNQIITKKVVIGDN